MSSIPLNSRNITMISRPLREVYEPGERQDWSRRSARYITRRFQEETIEEGRLRIALSQFIKMNRLMAQAVDRWDNEGGAVKGKK